MLMALKDTVHICNTVAEPERNPTIDLVAILRAVDPRLNRVYPLHVLRLKFTRQQGPRSSKNSGAKVDPKYFGT